MNNEPKILTARYTSNCNKCNALINPGDKMIYWPEQKHNYHASCGREAYQNFWYALLIKAIIAYNLANNI